MVKTAILIGVHARMECQLLISLQSSCILIHGTSVGKNSVDSDQLATSVASLSVSTLFSDNLRKVVHIVHLYRGSYMSDYFIFIKNKPLASLINLI